MTILNIVRSADKSWTGKLKFVIRREEVHMAEIKINKGHGIFYECPECGEKIELGQNYCSECGEPIDWKEDHEREMVEA